MTTKLCPYCGGTALVEIMSQRVKICNSRLCKREVPWDLDPGQKPVFEATAIDEDFRHDRNRSPVLSKVPPGGNQ